MNNSVVVPTATTVTNPITVNPRREELKALSNSLKPLEDENQTSINAADVLRMFWNPETIEYYEECKVLYLDRAHHILGVYNVNNGGLNGTVMDVRMIFQGALIG